MANEKSPDVRLPWPGSGHATSPSVGDARNLLRLRLPGDRDEGPEGSTPRTPDAPTDLDALIAEVARLRSEVNLLQRRVEDLELNDRHRTDTRDYSGDA